MFVRGDVADAGTASGVAGAAPTKCTTWPRRSACSGSPTAPIESIERNIAPVELLLAAPAAKHRAGEPRETLSRQQQRGLRQEPQVDVDRRGRPRPGSDQARPLVVRRIEGDRRIPGLAYHRQARAAGRRGPVLQRRRAAADGPLRHGAAAVRRARAGRPAAHRPRRRPARSAASPTCGTSAGR